MTTSTLVQGLPPTAAEAVARYEQIQSRLPEAKFPETSIHKAHLGELTDDIDCFVLDGFGVLNIGNEAVPGAVNRINTLRASGKEVRVLTNGATMPTTNTVSKYIGWGLEFERREVVSSRDALARALLQRPDGKWGFVAIEESGLQALVPDSLLLADDAAVYDACDGFVLLGARDWTAQRQDLLEASLRRSARPVLVGNPDLVAPHPGVLSREPGLFAHALIDADLASPQFYGKPFDNAFAIVRETVASIDPARIAMVGDTLHTDILGGAQAGWKTILVTDHGLLKGQDVSAAIRRSGIVPDYIVPTT